MKSNISFFLLLILIGLQPLTSTAQNHKLWGKVIDSKTKKSLAFVNITTQNGQYGCSTDIDGKFQLNIPNNVDSLQLSYVGYKKRNYAISSKKKYLFEMQAQSYLLSEFEIRPGDNPAHRIIKNVVANRDINDPKKLKSYSFTSYDKMIITADIDRSIMVDSAAYENDSLQKISDFIADKDILLMENVVEKKYLAPDRTNEKVVASRVSGLKDPLIVFVVSQVQSTSFYDEIIHVVNKNYINPISKGSLNKYFFHIEDTSYSAEGDTIYSISYQPYANTNFDGLQGVLSISTKKWAIVNVRAKPVDTQEQDIDIEIQQLYDFIDGHWFPIQLNTNIIFNNMNLSSNTEAAKLVGIGKSYYKNIHLNPELVKREFTYLEIELDPNAGHREEDYWKQYRLDSLSKRDQRTYAFMDSVGEAENFDRAVKQAETLLTGKIPWGKFEIPLDKFAGYNNYEGFWGGAGIRTNKRLSTKWNMGIYGAYAFRAKKAKYGIDATILLYKPYALSIYAAYSNDFQEAADVSYYNNLHNVLSPDQFKDYFISRANYTDRKEAYIRFRSLRYMHASIGLRVDEKEASYDYYFQTENQIIPENIFHFTALRIGLRYAYKERYFDNSRMLLSMGSNYPIIWFNYTLGLKNFLDGGYNYQRFDIQIRESFYTKYLGETSISLNGGFIIGDIPYSNLYRGQGSYGLFTIYAPNSFGSMSANEFLSDRYISAYFSHNFGSLLFRGEKFKPEFVVISNIGFGWLSHPESHHQINFKTMDLGYYESGLLINNILNLYLYQIGIGATYRYGPYSNRLFEDNISVKLSLTIPFKPTFKAVE